MIINKIPGFMFEYQRMFGLAYDPTNAPKQGVH